MSGFSTRGSFAHILSRRMAICVSGLLLATTAISVWAETAGPNTGPTAVQPSVEVRKPSLMLSPMRVVFEGKQRTAEIQLLNQGDKTATYRILFENRRMSETGSQDRIQEPGPGEHFADKLVRYTPHQVTLEPGKSQVLRLQLRKPQDLPDGEYRSHLRFSLVPSETPEAGAGEATSISVHLIPIYGVAIPVIVRQGSLSLQSTISDVVVERGAQANQSKPSISFSINRSGDMSTYGNIYVRLLVEGKKPAEIGRAKGLAVYVPNGARRVQMALRLPDDCVLNTGKIEITYVPVVNEVERGQNPYCSCTIPIPTD